MTKYFICNGPLQYQRKFFFLQAWHAWHAGHVGPARTLSQNFNILCFVEAAFPISKDKRYLKDPLHVRPLLLHRASRDAHHVMLVFKGFFPIFKCFGILAVSRSAGVLI